MKPSYKGQEKTKKPTGDEKPKSRKKRRSEKKRPTEKSAQAVLTPAELKLAQLATLAHDPSVSDTELADLAIADQLGRTVLDAVKTLNILKNTRPVVYHVLVRFYFETLVLEPTRFRELVESDDATPEEIAVELYGLLPSLIATAKILKRKRPQVLEMVVNLIAKNLGPTASDPKTD